MPRGFGLLEGLIAVLILSLGLLGLARYQTSLLAQTTEAQSRVKASALADELLSTVLVDAGNAGCYTLPQTGTCGSATATARATEWKARALAALPGATAPTSTLDVTTRRYTVTLNWTGNEVYGAAHQISAPFYIARVQDGQEVIEATCSLTECK